MLFFSVLVLGIVLFGYPKFFQNKFIFFLLFIISELIFVFLPFNNSIIYIKDSLPFYLAVLGFVLIGIFLVSIAIFVTYKFNWVKKTKDNGSIIKSLIFILCYLSKYKKDNMERFKESNQLKYFGLHAAAIVALKQGRFSIDYSMYADGVDLIKDYFKNVRHQPLYVYECKTMERAKKIIECERVTELWIFGHGTMNGLYFGKNGFLNYVKLKDASKKDFVGQFHCNYPDQCGYSLADLILKEDGKKFIPEGYRSARINRKAIEFYNELDWDVH